MTQWFNVGKVVNTHGVRGEVRVIATTDFPEERFNKGAILYLNHQELKERLPLTVVHHRRHKNFDLLTFEGRNNINDVQAFKGGVLQVNEQQLTELEGEHEFYYHEIIGCDVVTLEGEQLGKIKDILSTGANDVWVIGRMAGAKDLLIPYIEKVVKEVDLTNKKIIIDLIPGLE